MLVKIGILAMAVIACSASSAPECSCPRVVRPVCGTDGRQYKNPCDARCNRVDVAHPGRCLGVLVARPPCTCDRTKKPVCGSDGKTYDNDCLLNCATQFNSKLGIAFHGPCNVKIQPECTCPEEESPVCGSDGVSYGNDCWLNCATAHNSRLSVAYSGFCKDADNQNDDFQPECTCADDHKPVCGSDGITYDNDCWLNCATIYNARLGVAHSGFCDGDGNSGNGQSKQPECTCGDNHSPVCGSDGITYNNDCWLNCATQYNSRLSIAHSGFCKDSNVDSSNTNQQPECMCESKHSPVCGSDGVTYDNDCWLNCATVHNSRLSVVHSGFCVEEGSESEPNSCSCSKKSRPVCGNDGITYNNSCLMRCAGARKARQGPCEARA